MTAQAAQRRDSQHLAVRCPDCRAAAEDPCTELRGGIHGDARRGRRPHLARMIDTAVHAARQER